MISGCTTIKNDRQTPVFSSSDYLKHFNVEISAFNESRQEQD